MKRLMLLFLLISTCTINADLRYDRKTEKFYSIQNSHNIDQEEYNELCKECADINKYSAGSCAFKWGPVKAWVPLFDFLIS